MSEKLFKSLPAEKLEQMGLDKCYLLFFNNVEGLEYFSEPLGSPNRLARNVNSIALFRSYSDLETFYTNVALNQILSEDKDIQDFTIKEKIAYFIVDSQEKVFTENSVVDYIFNKYKDKNNLDIDHREKLSFCKQFISDVPIYNEITYNTIELLNEIVPENYHMYTKTGKMPTNIEHLQAFIYTTTSMNYLFSVYAMATNSEYTTQIKCLEMNQEDLLKFWSLYIPDLDTDLSMMSEQNKDYVFPVYEVWKQLETEFYNDIKDRWVDFDVIINQITSKTKTEFNDTDDIIDFSELI
jgi:hypothetical protein